MQRTSGYQFTEAAIRLQPTHIRSRILSRTSTGKEIDDIAPGLVQGPEPTGAVLANLDNVTRRIFEELGYQAVGNIRAILNQKLVDPIQRPQLDFSVSVFAGIIDSAVGETLTPPFNPYANTLNYVAIAYNIATVVQQYLVEIVNSLAIVDLRRVGVGILGTASGRVGSERTLAYERVNMTVLPYRFTVERFSTLVAENANRLGNCGIKNEGLIVPFRLGAENRTTSNVLQADVYSLSYPQTEREVMRTLYGTGDATRPGGFFPRGFGGFIALFITRSRLS
ncbi:hypothetical protein PTKIN_Ptkin15bG0083400 [Pterospermum kingtungense]